VDVLLRSNDHYLRRAVAVVVVPAPEARLEVRGIHDGGVSGDPFVAGILCGKTGA
jgi:hypothetical protein